MAHSKIVGLVCLMRQREQCCTEAVEAQMTRMGLTSAMLTAAVLLGSTC